LGVEIFFVIASLVIAGSEQQASLAAFARGRFRCLAPAAWICLTISLIALASARNVDPHVLGLAYAKTLSFFPTAPWIDDAYWTLDVEIAFYGFVGLFICFGRRTWLVSGVGFVGSASVMFWIDYWLQGRADGPLASWMRALSRSRYADLALPRHGCFSCIGVIVWSAKIARRLRPRELGLAAPCICGGILEIAPSSQSKSEVTGQTHGAAVPAAIWLVALLAILASIDANARMRSIRSPRRARSMGLATYSLYLLQTVVGGATMKTMASLGAPPWVALIGGVAVALGLAILVSVHLGPPPRDLMPGAARWRRAHIAWTKMRGFRA